MAYEDLSRAELVEVVQALEDEIDYREETYDDLEQHAKKIKADFENYKAKQDERRDKWREEAQKELAEELIRVLDNLERAMMAADEDSQVVKGVEMVADELFNILKERGLERITAESDTFDPRIHNAVDTTPHEQDDIVVETRRPGYRYNGDVLREADVVVGKQDVAGDEHTESN